jgi:hypothetical protein
LASPAHASLLLDANFDSETVDQNIPTGGAAAGEPASVSVPGMAVVRQGAFTTPSLQITDTSTTGATFVTFEFLGSTQVNSGTIEVKLRLRFAQLGNYILGLREQGGAADDFLDINFGDTGFMVVGGSAITYDTTTPLEFDLLVNMDAHTCDVVINGSTLVRDQPLGAPTAGIGSILFGHSFDSDTSGAFDLDDLVVMAPADAIFRDSFDLTSL